MVTVYNMLWWAMSIGGCSSKSTVTSNVYRYIACTIYCVRQRLSIDAFLNLLEQQRTVDGHRLQSIVVGDVYRWTPSPTYFYVFFFTSYDVLMYCCEYQVPIPFRKPRASTKGCHINTSLRIPVDLFMMGVRRRNIR